MNSNSNISATFLINCGILLEFRQHQILIDGLIRRPSDEINTSGLAEMSEEMYHSILTRKYPFQNVEIILSTHEHWDHCDHSDAEKYCRKYNAVFLTASEDESGYTYENDWCRIESICCPHDYPSNTGNRRHCCFRITLEDKIFLFTGDMDTKMTAPRPEIYSEPVDYLFYNVHHLFHPEGRGIIHHYIRPEHLFIQHLPDPGSDPYRLNYRLENKLKVFGHELPPCTILNTPMQKIL